MKTTIAGVLAVAACGALPAYAQDTGASLEAGVDAPAQTVAVRGVKDPAIASYAMAYDMLSKVRNAGSGKVDLVVRLLSSKTLQPMPDLELSLQGETLTEKLSLSPEGFLDIPLDKRYLDDKAEFVTNKKKGSVRAEYYIVPKFHEGDITYIDLAAAMAAAKRATTEIVPWYLRLLMSSTREVRFCYPDKLQAIGLEHGGERSTRPAASEQKNFLNKQTVYCAAFKDRETDIASDTRLALPPGWVALFH